MEPKRHLTYPLRLSPSVREHASAVAQQEGISLNHFISLAVAEKLSRMEHDNWIKQQARQAGHPVTRGSALHGYSPIPKRPS